MKRKLLLPGLVFLFFIPVRLTGQQTENDSLLVMLNRAVAGNVVDTNRLMTVARSIRETRLTDSQINELVGVSNTLHNEDFKAYIKQSILSSMGLANNPAAINFGKSLVQELEQRNTPNALLIKHFALASLRYPFRNSDQLQDGFDYFNKKLRTYTAENDSIGRSVCYFVLSTFYYTYGLYDQAVYSCKKLNLFLPSPTSEKPFLDLAGFLNGTIRDGNPLYANILAVKGDYKEALEELANLPGADTATLAYELRIRLDCLLGLNLLESIPLYLEKVPGATGSLPHKIALDQTIAHYYIIIDSIAKAEQILNRCREQMDGANIPASSSGGVLFPEYYLALTKIQQKDIEAAIQFLRSDIQHLLNLRIEKLRDYRLMASLYQEKNDFKNAAITYEDYLLLQDSVLADQNRFRNNSFETEQQINEQELSITRLQNDNKISKLVRNFLIGIALLVITIAILLYYRYKNKQRDNQILQNTLHELKATQQQLIQSEKMASLGELTAGIAHEIQNPLNFVNNFSEVNKELIEELKSEKSKAKGERDEKLEEELLNDIKENSEKINHHGKRADAIVKGMLQHSRSSSGTKELTDINTLCDEYLRLAYHGLRAKDKSFNAKFETDFDLSVEKINIVPQDIGRVILNLINNAFYAVTEKAKGSMPNADGYEPTIKVSTKKENGSVTIRVKDNANGIPDSIKEKIFQPFFTTKPTGQGTGLGLSLSYDIVKAHGGEIKVETKENEGTEFSILLPVV
jgi:signal transduction histidine kinase